MTNNQLSVSRTLAFTYVVLAYLVALLASLATGFFCRQAGYSELAVVGLADGVGTVVIFIFSLLFRNSSFYDPYWSVAPIVIALYWATLGWDGGADPLRLGLLLVLVTVWGIRLTYNWARGWRGLQHQDWRYDQLSRQTGRWYWVVSFLGIHFFPTVLVYLGCWSLWVGLGGPARPFNGLDVVATVITLVAIGLETIADEQLRRFMRSEKAPGSTLTSGVWRFSRHPNYLGETGFWWGLYVFALAARPDYWWVVVGPVTITLLFQFISIPMIERRMRERRHDYEKVVKTVPRWIPWFKRS